MNLNPLDPGFYAPTNRLLIQALQRDIENLADDWMMEAADAAVAGNPARAGYIEYMIGRLQ